jgi:predicted PurR-regulated permease PerM
MTSPVYRSSQPIHPRTDGWTNAAILRTVALVVLVLLGVVVMWRASDIVLLIFLGILFGLSVASGARRLERFRIPRTVGAVGIVLGAVLVVFGIFSYAGPSLVEQTAAIRQGLPAALAKAQAWIAEHTSGASATPAPAGHNAVGQHVDTTAAVPSLDVGSQVGDAIKFASTVAVTFLSSSLTVLAGIGLMVVLAVYIGAEQPHYRRGLITLFPPKARPRAAEVLDATAAALHKWLITQLIAMAVIGVANFVAFEIIGVQAAFALALIAGLLEFIPTLGPIISGAIAVAMASIDSPSKALWVLIAVVVIQQLEGNVLIPYLMRGALDLPPALTIVMQALMAVLFGFAGMLVAVPLLAAVVVPVRMLYIEDHLGGRWEPPPKHPRSPDPPQ